MADITPKLRTKFGESVGVELYINFPDLETKDTYLTADSSSGASSFSVENGLSFAIDEYILTGHEGNEKAEILRTHGSTAPTATAITLDATTSSFSHNRGDRIRFIPYNQIVIERSTDAGATYTPLATVDLRADSTETYYNHTAGASTDYYRIRFKNEADTTYSEYSDGVIGTGYTANSAGSIIRKALLGLGEDINSTLTKEFLYDALDEGRRELDEDERIIRWEFRTAFNYKAYSIIPGEYKFTLPTDLRDSATNKNILNVKVGRNKDEAGYADQNMFDSFYKGIGHTTLNGAVVTADTSITLANSGEMTESGAITIAGQAVNEELDVVDYTANDESTNIISGVTGIRAAGHADGTDVWQGATYGIPTAYTVDNSVISFSQPFSNDIDGESIYLDYYKKLVSVNSDSDTLDEPFYSIFIPYLRYRIKLRKDENLAWQQDPDYISWIQKKEAQINKQYLGQDMRIGVSVPGGRNFRR